jgi:hypothetical protein
MEAAVADYKKVLSTDALYSIATQIFEIASGKLAEAVINNLKTTIENQLTWLTSGEFTMGQVAGRLTLISTLIPADLDDDEKEEIKDHIVDRLIISGGIGTARALAIRGAVEDLDLEEALLALIGAFTLANTHMDALAFATLNDTTARGLVLAEIDDDLEALIDLYLALKAFEMAYGAIVNEDVAAVLNATVIVDLDDDDEETGGFAILLGEVYDEIQGLLEEEILSVSAINDFQDNDNPCVYVELLIGVNAQPRTQEAGAAEIARIARLLILEEFETPKPVVTVTVDDFEYNGTLSTTDTGIDVEVDLIVTIAGIEFEIHVEDIVVTSSEDFRDEV